MLDSWDAISEMEKPFQSSEVLLLGAPFPLRCRAGFVLPPLPPPKRKEEEKKQIRSCGRTSDLRLVLSRTMVNVQLRGLSA